MKKKLVSFLMAAIFAIGASSGVINKVNNSSGIQAPQVIESNAITFGSDEPDPW